MREDAGLTLLETVVAIAVCAIVLGVLATVSTGTLRESRQGNYKAQATQVLDTLGRRIAGGHDVDLLLQNGNALGLDGAYIDDTMNLDTFADGAFVATISNLGPYSVQFTTLYRYQVEVCYDVDSSADRCVSGLTLGREGVN